MVVVVMLAEGVMMVMVGMMVKKEVMMKMVMIRLVVSISSGPGSRTHLSSSLYQENTRK